MWARRSWGQSLMSEKFYKDTVSSIQIFLEKFVLCLMKPVQLVWSSKNVYTHLSRRSGSLRYLICAGIVIIVVKIRFSRRQGPFLWRRCIAWWCWRWLRILDWNMCDFLPSSGLCGSGLKYVGFGSWVSDLRHSVWWAKGWSDLTSLNKEVHMLQSCAERCVKWWHVSATRCNMHPKHTRHQADIGPWDLYMQDRGNAKI